MKLRRPARRETGENVVPLINVVFLLLIFFMLAGQISRSDPFPLEPPESASEDAAREAAARTLYVAADGRVALGGETLALDAVAEAVGRLPAPIRARLRLKSDQDAPARRVMAVLERAQAGGARQVDLLTVAGRP